MIELPEMHRFSDYSLQLSVEAPETWSGTKENAHHLDLFAPEEQDYSAHLSLQINRLAPPDTEPDWFVNLIKRTYFQGEIGLEHYELVESFEFDLGGHPAFLARYEWVSDEVGLHFSHVDTLVLTGPDSFLEIHGFSLKELESKYVPIFVYMINSIQFEPPATESAPG